MSRFSRLMRLLFTWLVAFGVLVGLHGRAIAADPCAMLIAMHAEEHAGHDHDTESPCDPSHDKNCPLEHHQHCSCVDSMPIADCRSEFSRLECSLFSMAPIRSESELIPEGPYADLDKPPLI